MKQDPDLMKRALTLKYYPDLLKASRLNEKGPDLTGTIVMFVFETRNV